MDLSFFRTREHLIEGKPVSAELPVLLAVSSAQQAASPTVRALTSHPRGRSEERDHIQALARMFAPGRGDADAAPDLNGSFNPLIAKDLMVGQ